MAALAVNPAVLSRSSISAALFTSGASHRVAVSSPSLALRSCRLPRATLRVSEEAGSNLQRRSTLFRQLKGRAQPKICCQSVAHVEAPSQSDVSANNRHAFKLPVQLVLAAAVANTLIHKLVTIFSSVGRMVTAPVGGDHLGESFDGKKLLLSAGPLFFAAMSASTGSRVPMGPSDAVSPLVVVAAAIQKWLELYSSLLFVRVLLSWFPNIPWERQPMVAIRDMCDPYLNLFRSILPPFYNALDLSPILAFMVLGVMSTLVSMV
eukprot:jgi/Mesen1/8887/ME000535S08194